MRVLEMESTQHATPGARNVVLNERFTNPDFRVASDAERFHEEPATVVKHLWLNQQDTG